MILSGKQIFLHILRWGISWNCLKNSKGSYGWLLKQTPSPEQYFLLLYFFFILLFMFSLYFTHLFDLCIIPILENIFIEFLRNMSDHLVLFFHVILVTIVELFCPSKENLWDSWRQVEAIIAIFNYWFL